MRQICEHAIVFPEESLLTSKFDPDIGAYPQEMSQSFAMDSFNDH